MSTIDQRRAGVVASALSLGALAAGYLAVCGSRSQVFGPFPYAGPATSPADRQPRVALTFDDGPNEPWTSVVLDALAERGVRATFFQVGRCAERWPTVTRRVVADGHVLGNHSYSHAARTYLSDPRQRREFARGRDTLADIAGVVPRLYRPPWLCHPSWVLRTVRSGGAVPVSGTFGHPLEVVQPAAARIARGAAARVRPGTILILHDGREARGGRRDQTAAAVGPLIDRLIARGYGFATVDELLDEPAYA